MQKDFYLHHSFDKAVSFLCILKELNGLKILKKHMEVITHLLIKPKLLGMKMRLNCWEIIEIVINNN